MTIAELNACNRDRFVATFGWIFERSPWVAERAWASRPFASGDELHRAMVEALRSASRVEQLDLLCAHPDLGTKARMSDASVGEQTGAGLDRLTPEEYHRLTTSTSAYRARFGFPFLLAVKGLTKHDVFTALAERLPRNPDAEWQEALEQVGRIAVFRLRDVVD
jgi:2-oxo-4-hydroxy-4-carboxy-5-ureidoimidazoline decarboxylase